MTKEATTTHGGRGAGMTTEEKPQFEHDCDQCVFLGRYADRDAHDLYFCAETDGGTFIARWGDDGPEYASTLGTLLERGEIADKQTAWRKPLNEAYRRAYEQGLYERSSLRKAKQLDAALDSSDVRWACELYELCLLVAAKADIYDEAVVAAVIRKLRRIEARSEDTDAQIYQKLIDILRLAKFR